MMPLTLITKRDIIKKVAINWEEQYKGRLNQKSLSVYNKDKTYGEVLAGLKQLDLATCAEGDVIAALGGNNSWTSLTCDNCGMDVNRIVQVGDEPDYESSTANLCQKCAVSAVELFLEDNYNEHS